MRHGESLNNASPVPVPDPPLTERGRRQAARLAASWAGRRCAAVVSSALWRALETAEALAAATASPWLGWPELVEWNRSFPRAGRSAHEVRARFPAVRFEPPLAAVHWPAYPGEETLAAAAARADRVLARVRTAFPAAARVALVGHQGFGGLLLCRWLGAPPQDHLFRQGNCRVHTLELRPGRTVLVRANAPVGPAAPGDPDAAEPPPAPEGHGSLFLVCRGQTAARAATGGPGERSLTAAGAAQAEWAARALGAAPLAAVVCGPSAADREIAHGLARRAGVRVEVWTELAALGAGGQAAVAEGPAGGAPGPAGSGRGAPPVATRAVAGGTHPGPEGWRRAERALERLRAITPLGGATAAVLPGASAALLLAVWCGAARDGSAAFAQDEGAVSHLSWTADGRRFVWYTNRVPDQDAAGSG